MVRMIEKAQIDRYIETKIGIELDNKTYYKGILKEVSDTSIVLEFLNGKKIIVSLKDVHFVKVL